jgi:hypothetical protein
MLSLTSFIGHLRPHAEREHALLASSMDWVCGRFLNAAP